MKIFGRIIIFSILLLLQLSSTGQNKKSQSDFNTVVIQPYIKDNVLFKEQVYIHFNKSCYLPGDDIWFTAYVIDPTTGQLNPYTKNLYVELYNEKGKLQGQKLLPVNNGTSNNMFKLEENALPGQYIFRAYTNWMKNFASTEEFDRPIEVIGDINKEKVASDIQYDIQFFAEGGNLLEGVFNKVAVKALDPNGKSAVLKGVVVDDKNDSIAFFQLNKMGMGQFVINPVKNSTYKAKIILPGGHEQLINLPPVENKGVIASVNSFVKNRIMVEIKTNGQTLEKEQTFYILIHSNGNVFETLTTKLSPEKTSVSFSFDRGSAGNGVNCLTVFDENYHPVAERLFYNYKTDIKGKVNIQHSTKKDSTELRLSIVSDSVRHRYSDFSISILPEGTNSNHFTNSLLAEVLLKSGIRGQIENPQYYIEKQDVEHAIAMDMLLLTQGWRKYDWKNFNKASKKYLNKFENGFVIKGIVKNWLNGKEDKTGSVSIVSPENKLFSVGKLDSAGCYSFQGLYLTDSSKVIVSASNAKGKNWNRTLTASLEPSYSIDSVIHVKPNLLLPSTIEQKIELPLKLMPGVIALPEFVITAEVKKPFEHSVYVSSFDKSVEITKEKYLRYGTIENLLRIEFNVRVELDPEGNLLIDMGRAQKTAQPKLIINDIEATDMSFLTTYTLDQIEAVSVNKDGNAITGDGGAVIIQIRKEAMDWGSGAPTNMKNLFIKGFAQPVQYYVPKYLQAPGSEAYKKYAAIFWKPDMEIDSTGVSSFKFNVPREVQKINVRTEGISEDGTIYLDERIIEIRKEN